ncbi:MAG: hypothetical protein J5752_05450 [Clostridiales bacterium]|nr:hypothetical protein [Clostridiales bacterium]
MPNKKALVTVLAFTTTILVVTTGILIAWKAGLLFSEKKTDPVATSAEIWTTSTDAGAGETKTGTGRSKIEFRTAYGGEITDEARMAFWEKADNFAELSLSVVWSFPCYSVRSVKEREEFLQLLDQYITFTNADSENESIKEVLAGFDETFFQQHALVLVTQTFGPGEAYRFVLDRIGVANFFGDTEVWSVVFLQSSKPDAYYSKQENLFWIFSLEKALLDDYDHGVTAYTDGLIPD